MSGSGGREQAEDGISTNFVVFQPWKGMFPTSIDSSRVNGVVGNRTLHWLVSHGGVTVRMRGDRYIYGALHREAEAPGDGLHRQLANIFANNFDHIRGACLPFVSATTVSAMKGRESVTEVRTLWCECAGCNNNAYTDTHAIDTIPPATQKPQCLLANYRVRRDHQVPQFTAAVGRCDPASCVGVSGGEAGRNKMGNAMKE